MRTAMLATALCLGAIPAYAPSAYAQSTLDGILSRGTLRVGLTGDYRPFSIKEDGGSFQGLDVDMAQSLAKGLGVKLEIVPTTWPTLMAGLQGGKYDIAMGGITITLDRAKTALFSTAVMTSGKTPIARCADKGKYSTIAEIDKPDVRVIFNPGGTNEKFAKAELPHAHLMEFPDNKTVFQQIVDGKADVMVTDAVETRLQSKLHPELCPVHPDHPFNTSELGYMMPRDLVWQQFVDTWLAIQKQTGERTRALAKWLG